MSAIRSRIEQQTGSTGLLAGYHFMRNPVSRVDGLSDLPMVSVQGFELVEDYGTAPTIWPSVRLAIALATRRDLGPDGFAEAVERVIDSIETNDDGEFDGTLDGLLTEWVTTELTDVGIGDMSISGMVIVTAKPTRFNRGSRRTS